MTKQREERVIPWGKKSMMRVTTTKDDETGVELLEFYAKRGRSVTRAKIERDMASGALLSLNGTPMPPASDESLQAKFARMAAEGVAAMADRDPDEGKP